MTPVDYEVGIIGGGPGGSSMAAYLAKAGVKCVVFERETFPREHVGESLVPSSTRVFKDLGFLEKMEEYKFPHKYGAVWTASAKQPVYSHRWEELAAGSRADIRFQETAQPGVDQHYTYHVDRGKFDHLLLQHAAEFGAAVHEGVAAQGAELDGKDHATILYRTASGKACRANVRMVVDASGRRTVMGNQMKWRIKDPVFDQYAIHTWFEGYDRRCLAYKENLDNFVYIHFLPITNSWVWQIPITETITSIGVVTQKKHFSASRESREDFFWQCVGSRQELYNGLKAAKQIRPFKEEGDYSYAMKQIAGDRLVLVGDAARFVDPIFATGVSIALNCSRIAHADILRALEIGVFTRDAFKNYETILKRGTRNWYNFITVYYRLNVLFTAFILDPRYRLDVLRLLQGDVYEEEEPPVLTRMREIVQEVENNPKHIWHKLLGDLTANAFATAAVETLA